MSNYQRASESHSHYFEVIRSLEYSWRELCLRYLPIKGENSEWRYSRLQRPDEPEQGWKFHIAGTVLSASKILQNIGPFLHSRGIFFKGPSSLQELYKINCGLFYGYCQVGKCITVYPQNTEEAVALAPQLHKLTRNLPAPAVPFDFKYRQNSCLFYRYGSFIDLEIVNPDGTRTPAMRDPVGNLVPDLRESGFIAPEWAPDPLPKWKRHIGKPADNPLKTTLRVYRALSQRGKGGVYQAIDFSAPPPRACVLKEGRRHGETDWLGRDGRWRIKREARVLPALRAAGIDAPRVYSSFEVDKNYYLVTEFIEGETLHSFLLNQPKRVSVSQCLRYGYHIARIIQRIHSAGWVWRDCTPSNIICTGKGRMRPLDFEGACPADQPDPLPWGTPGYSPPESSEKYDEGAGVAEDLYALGAIIYQLLTGRLPDTSELPIPIYKLRRNVPSSARAIVEAILNRDPQSRPGAHTVAQVLKEFLV